VRVWPTEPHGHKCADKSERSVENAQKCEVALTGTLQRDLLAYKPLGQRCATCAAVKHNPHSVFDLLDAPLAAAVLQACTSSGTKTMCGQSHRMCRSHELNTSLCLTCFVLLLLLLSRRRAPAAVPGQCVAAAVRACSRCFSCLPCHLNEVVVLADSSAAVVVLATTSSGTRTMRARKCCNLPRLCTQLLLCL
jgi:hypothetical protein